jgi:hypothetical protein
MTMIAEDESHLEEQALEIEALQSIYMEDLQELKNDASHPTQWNCTQRSGDGRKAPSKPVYMVQVYPQRDDDGQDPSSYEFGIELYFSHAVGYPDAVPFVHVSSIRGLSADQVAQCAENVANAVDENAGMPMIFSLVTAVQDWLNGLDEDQKEMARRDDPKEQEQRRRMEEEERIQKLRKHGHEVTAESFLAWREQFLAEDGEGKRPQGESDADRLTGKAWFLQQQTPAEPDVDEYDEDEDFVDEEEEEDDDVSIGFDDSDDDDDLLLDELEEQLS